MKAGDHQKHQPQPRSTHRLISRSASTMASSRVRTCARCGIDRQCREAVQGSGTGFGMPRRQAVQHSNAAGSVLPGRPPAAPSPLPPLAGPTRPPRHGSGGPGGGGLQSREETSAGRQAAMAAAQAVGAAGLGPWVADPHRRRPSHRPDPHRRHPIPPCKETWPGLWWWVVVVAVVVPVCWDLGRVGMARQHGAAPHRPALPLRLMCTACLHTTAPAAEPGCAGG